jgi:ElaB/YqjD/DUF883 family membrane-anchored ribosome-binding protein
MNTVTPTPTHLDQPRSDTAAAAEARELASREAARIGEMARDWWQRNTRTALDLADSVKGEAVAAGERTRQYVRDEPMRSVLVAVAAGAVISGVVMLLGRRSR